MPYSYSPKAPFVLPILRHHRLLRRRRIHHRRGPWLPIRRQPINGSDDHWPPLGGANGFKREGFAVDSGRSACYEESTPGRHLLLHCWFWWFSRRWQSQNRLKMDFNYWLKSMHPRTDCTFQTHRIWKWHCVSKIMLTDKLLLWAWIEDWLSLLKCFFYRSKSFHSSFSEFHCLINTFNS